MSARKRMSLRAIARMKRENRELKERVGVATKRDEYRTLTTWSDIGQRVCDEINIVRRLGYDCECYSDGKNLTLAAIKRVPA